MTLLTKAAQMNFIIILLFFFLSACTATNRDPVTDSWVGKPANALLQQKGAPNQILPLDNGHTQFVYFTQIRMSHPSSMSNPTVIVGPNGRTAAANLPSTPANTTSYNVVVCTRTYEIDGQHRVISEQAQGMNCH